ncbi:hypothetical protein D7Y11_35260 [Corallococcus sp. AB018]|uniref:YfhO family protein n=2 Tax=Corallococcus TaxID=83461 RepID=UPI000F89C82F|nr:YfhO family protein [Corallococcus sp. AB018]RUO88481.1 hypothetical protein D7Y11_35260 [Corallococcus sp. AB018]
MSSTPPLHRRELLSVLGALCAATLLFFHRLLASGGIFCERDMLRVCLPAKWLWVQAVRQWEWPDWTPFDSLGQPFAGATVTGAFHPANLLGMLVEGPAMLTLMVLVCYPVAALGTYVLLRRWGTRPGAAAVGALGFAFGGALVSLTNSLPYLQAAMALPWLLVATDAVLKHASWAAAGAVGLVLGTLLFAGDPQGFAVGGATVLAVAAFGPLEGAPRRKVLLAAGAGLGLALLVSAVQLWASASVLRETFAERRTLETAVVWSTHPLRLLDMALGNVFALERPLRAPVAEGLLGTQVNDFWLRSLYVGLPMLFLAGVAAASRWRERRVQLALGLTVLFVLLMFGRHTPLYALVYELLPPWRPFRYPEKLSVHVAFWLAVLAGLGAESLVAREAPGRRRVAWVLGGMGLGVLLLALTGTGARLAEALSGFYSGRPELWPEVARQVGERLTEGGLRTGSVCLALGLLLVWRKLQPRPLALVLVTLVAVDVAWVTEPVYVSCDRDLIEAQPLFVETMRQRVGSETLLGQTRVYTAVATIQQPSLEGLSLDDRDAAANLTMLVPDVGARWGVEAANWYLPTLSARVGALLKDQRQWWRRYAGLAGVGFFTLDTLQVQKRGMEKYVVAESEPFGVQLLANPLALPRVYLAAPRCVAGPEESLALIASSDFVPGRQAAVECLTPLPQPAPDAELGSVRVVERDPDGSTVEVDAKQPAVLVASEAYFSGWTATVDGAPAEVLPTNHAFLGVALPEGRHQVIWRFIPPGQGMALAVSGLGVGLCLLPWLLRLRRVRRA